MCGAIPGYKLDNILRHQQISIQMNQNIHVMCMNYLYMLFVMKKEVIIDVINARII